jgi:hypothetical protein
LDNEFKRIRLVIGARERPVLYSEAGRRFSLVGLMNAGIALGITLSLGAVAFAFIGWRYRVEPGKASRRYSSIIVALVGSFMAFTIFYNESFRGGPWDFPYESLVTPAVVLATHLIALIMQKPRPVLGAFSLMIGILSTTALYFALGWLAFPNVPQLVGLILGVALLIYGVNGTLQRNLFGAD